MDVKTKPHDTFVTMIRVYTNNLMPARMISYKFMVFTLHPYSNVIIINGLFTYEITTFWPLIQNFYWIA